MPVHTAHIRSLVPKDNLLEFHPKDGWEPLCKFLGKDVPAGQPFPHVNQGQHSANIIKIVVAVKLVKIGFPYLVAIGAVWAAWKWDILSQLN
jgi:hypothetical protein